MVDLLNDPADEETTNSINIKLVKKLNQMKSMSTGNSIIFDGKFDTKINTLSSLFDLEIKESKAEINKEKSGLLIQKTSRADTISPKKMNQYSNISALNLQVASKRNIVSKFILISKLT